MTHRQTSLNRNLVGMRCVRCGVVHPVADYFEGCPACLAIGHPASVAPFYGNGLTDLDPSRPESWLAYTGGPFLGEGRTPLIGLPRLADELGVPALAAKYEGANPTGSHKDRMSALVVQRALDIGASTVVAASTGNAGVSLAAYAANAGLHCVMVTTADMNANWRRAVEMYGAELIATETAEDRWRLVASKARDGSWYPVTNYLTPAVGSNPFGVDGYRAIALELHAQSGVNPPTDILVPTSRGDIIWGVAQGYCDLKQAGLVSIIPRVHAVEPFPRITRVSAGEDVRAQFTGSTAMVSLGGTTVTHQAIEALRLTGGSAVAVDDVDVLQDQKLFARAGLYLELSSVSSLSGLRKLLHKGTISRDARVVLVTTSHGYKEEARYERPIPITPIN
ncbi:threonine synthase [Burkholderia cepacia]|uniref:threonine synthase n=1 Tax=Burkholderia cepacia TaxID=292 RepID=UPI002AB6A287|nr:pyridoxal-phosphate dependent enzyme [Burkholderia cepacia]